MKNSEVVDLNAVFSNKMKIPAMSGDQLYALLSAKVDISRAAEGIEGKAQKSRDDTKPPGVDEYYAKMSDPRVREWYNRYVAMRARLLDEAYEGKMPDPPIERDMFPDMVQGLTPGEAILVMEYLVKR